MVKTSETAQDGDLFRRMIDKTGRPGKMGFFHEDNQARTAALKCATCECRSQCAKWLAEAEEGATPPEFCPNAAWMAWN